MIQDFIKAHLHHLKDDGLKSLLGHKLTRGSIVDSNALENSEKPRHFPTMVVFRKTA